MIGNHSIILFSLHILFSPLVLALVATIPLSAPMSYFILAYTYELEYIVSVSDLCHLANGFQFIHAGKTTEFCSFKL